MVQNPPEDPTEESQCHNPRKSRDGPARLLDNEHVPFPFEHGHNGRKRSTEEAGEELLGRLEGKLHGLADGSVCELQIRASGAQGARCEYRQSWVELLSELLEQREVTNSIFLRQFMFENMGCLARCKFTKVCSYKDLTYAFLGALKAFGPSS